MRRAVGLLCVCLLLGGCAAGGGQDTTTRTEERRFDGDANAFVSVTNPNDETWSDEVWNVTVRIERDGTVVLNETRTLAPEETWNVTVVDRPGNYTFTIGTEEWRDSRAVRLPRAVGDCDTFIDVVDSDGDYEVNVNQQIGPC